MKILPLGDRILVNRTKSEEFSKGGIILPHSARETKAEGTVVAVGPGRVDENGKLHEIRGVKAGDSVIFAKHAGTELKQDGMDCILIREEDVLAVLVSD